MGWICNGCNIHSAFLNCRFHICVGVLGKSAFQSGLFFRKRGIFFELVISLCFQPNPYTRMCVSTIGSFSLLRNKMKDHGKTLVEFCFFFWVLSDLYLSVYFNCLSRITYFHFFFWGGALPPSPPGPRGGGGGPSAGAPPRPHGGRHPLLSCREMY